MFHITLALLVVVLAGWVQWQLVVSGCCGDCTLWLVIFHITWLLRPSTNCPLVTKWCEKPPTKEYNLRNTHKPPTYRSRTRCQSAAAALFYRPICWLQHRLIFCLQQNQNNKANTRTSPTSCPSTMNIASVVLSILYLFPLFQSTAHHPTVSNQIKNLQPPPPCSGFCFFRSLAKTRFLIFPEFPPLWLFYRQNEKCPFFSPFFGTP